MHDVEQDRWSCACCGRVNRERDEACGLCGTDRAAGDAEVKRLSAEVKRLERSCGLLSGLLGKALELMRWDQKRSPTEERRICAETIRTAIEGPESEVPLRRLQGEAVVRAFQTLWDRVGPGDTAEEILAVIDATYQEAINRLPAQAKVLDLPHGWELWAGLDGEALVYAGDLFVQRSVQAQHRDELLRAVQAWLRTPEAGTLARRDDIRWKAAVEAERRWRTGTGFSKTRYQVAYRSTAFPGAVWLQPREGLPKDEAENLLRVMEERRPDLEHWVEPLQACGEIMRIQAAEGMTLSVTGCSAAPEVTERAIYRAREKEAEVSAWARARAN